MIIGSVWTDDAYSVSVYVCVHVDALSQGCGKVAGCSRLSSVNIFHSISCFWQLCIQKSCIVVKCLMPPLQCGAGIPAVLWKRPFECQTNGRMWSAHTEQPFKLCMFSFVNYLTSSLSLTGEGDLQVQVLSPQQHQESLWYCIFFILMLLINGHHVLKLEIRLRWRLERWLSGY